MEEDCSQVIEEGGVPIAGEVPRLEGMAIRSLSGVISDDRSDDGADMQGGSEAMDPLSPPTAMSLGLRPLQLVAFGSWPRWALSPMVPHESQGKKLFRS
jgi:hypothetical protein